MEIKYTIQELTKDDLDKGGLEGLLESLKNMSDTGNISLEEAKEILDRINSQNGHIYVAQTEDGEIIGTTTLLIEQKFIHKGAKIGHIEDVATRKGYERKGVVSAIMKEAIDAAREFGCYKTILDCKDTLIPFYERFGFYKHENCMRLDL